MGATLQQQELRAGLRRAGCASFSGIS